MTLTPSSLQAAEITRLGVLRLEGSQAHAFLQGQSTCDVARLANGAALPGACCNNKGRVLTLFYALKAAPSAEVDERITLLINAEVIAPLCQHLERYAKLHRVVLNDVSSSFSVFAVWQPESNGEAKTADLASAAQALAPYNPSQHANTLFCLCSRDELATLRAALAPLAQTATEAAWHTWRLNQGIAQITAKTFANFMPHQLNLPALGFVSFDKGCYTGQEIIARTQYRGKVKQCATTLTATQSASATLIPGATTTFAGQTGVLIDAATNANQTTALLLLKQDKST